MGGKETERSESNHLHPCRIDWRLPWTQRSDRRSVDPPLILDFSFFFFFPLFFLFEISEQRERECFRQTRKSCGFTRSADIFISASSAPRFQCIPSHPIISFPIPILPFYPYSPLYSSKSCISKLPYCPYHLTSTKIYIFPYHHISYNLNYLTIKLWFSIKILWNYYFNSSSKQNKNKKKYVQFTNYINISFTVFLHQPHNQVSISCSI